MKIDEVLFGDSIELMKSIPDNSIHLIASDIPYGISYDEWDVLHNNTNSALLGSSPAQEKAGSIFKKRGKPLNGWSEADKKIPLEYQDWCSTWAGDWLRVLKPGGSAFVFAGRRFAHRAICALEDAGFTFKDMISWEKNTAPHRAQRISLVYKRRGDVKHEKQWDGWRVGNLRPLFEPILWFVKPYKVGGTLADNLIDNELGAYCYDEWLQYSNNTSNIIKIPSNKNDHGLHPTQKPVALMESLIKLTTKPNQIVLDPFCGSGTTLVAAANLNRHYLGIEYNPDYYNTTVNRLSTINKHLF